MVDRSTLLLLMGHAGTPKQIIVAYASYMESSRAINRVGQHFGQPHFRERSIPQGGPWSMLLLNLVVVPWLRLLEDLP
eukprot:11270822-Alexandrium_andersonii.AAC.1